MSPPPLITATGLSKRFGTRQAVADLDLQVSAGRALGLLGPNGSGKTTTVRLLTGLLTPDQGQVRLFGQTLTRANADALRARIGVQTDTNLYELLTVEENLRTWGELFGLSAATRDRRIAEVLATFELTDRASSPVAALSKGMRQKVSVARAILHEPELLFLDEPTAGLDPEATEELIRHLKTMIETSRTTVVICTHQLHGLEALCDDLAIIDRGRLIASGTVEALLERTWPERRYLLRVAADPQAALEALDRAALGLSASRSGEVIELTTNDEDLLSKGIATLVEAGVALRAVIPVQRTIHDLYFAMLGEHRGA